MPPRGGKSRAILRGAPQKVFTGAPTNQFKTKRAPAQQGEVKAILPDAQHSGQEDEQPELHRGRNEHGQEAEYIRSDFEVR